jgi:O-antigen/teichoic acid export membrane protein
MSDGVGKNIFFTSLNGILQSILTLIFWIVAATLVDSFVIGFVGAILSFTIIITTVNSLNISFGMKGPLGKAFSLGNQNQIHQIFSSLVIFSIISILVSILFLSIPPLGILDFVGFDYEYYWIIILLFSSMSFQFIFSESLVSINRSKDLVMPMLIASFLRFPILFLMLEISDPISSIIISYSSVLFISTIIYGIKLSPYLKGQINLKNTFRNIKKLILISFVSWIPQLLSVLGSQLSTLTVFAISGASSGGKFYIPMMIFSVSLFIVSGITRVSHPVIAGMNSEQEQSIFLSYTTKIAFLLTIPLATPLLFFGNDFLGLFGPEFGESGSVLTILMLSFPIGIINEIIYYFVYGRGDNKSVLYLGIAGTGSRISLYFILVPIFDENGAAISFLIGTIIQFILTFIISKKHSLHLEYKKYIFLTTIPFSIAFVLWQFEINFVISTLVIIFTSLVVYVRINLFTPKDLMNILNSSLSEISAKKYYPILFKIMKKINPSIVNI